MPDHITHEFAHATTDQWPVVTEILTDSFSDDPVTRWAVNGTRGIRPLVQQLSKLYLKQGCVWLCGRHGVMMWCEPGKALTLPWTIGTAVMLLNLRYGGVRAVYRSLVYQSTCAAHRPREPHAYLFMVGVRQSNQHRGIGRRFIKRLQTICRENCWPIYLESTNPQNHRFYEQAEFRTAETFSIGGNGPPVTSFWWEPS